MPLGPGSIAFTGFNGDGNDDIAFVALEQIAAGTVIYFNDQEWQGSAFNTGEGQLTWTASSTIAPGTIVRISSFGSSPTSNLGTISGSSGLSNDSEIVYAYVGAAFAPTSFLAAIANDGFAQSGGTLNGTGLVIGQTAIDLAGQRDIGAFTGSRGDQASYASYAAQINNVANWTTQNTAADDSNDGSAPDVPFSTTGFTLASASEDQAVGFANLSVSRIEQDSGDATTFTFTVTRSGGTTGQLDFSGAIGNVTTDAADFGGIAPGSFSGSIAAGASSQTVTVTISGDTDIETNESFTLTLDTATNGAANVNATITPASSVATGTILNDDAPQVIGGITVFDQAASLEGDATPPSASADFQLIRLGSIAGTPAGSEVVAFADGIAYNMNNNAHTIDKIAIGADGALSSAGSIDFSTLPDFGFGNSVAVKDGILAFAYGSATFGAPGHVALFDVSSGALIKTVDVGIGPDQLTFSPDGTKLITADEAERVSAGDVFGGTVSIIDMSNGAANAVVTNTIGFSALDGYEQALINRGMAIAPGQTASNDIEPEYVAISPDGTRAYVTLQEVNAVAVIDLTDPSATQPIAIQPLGSIDRSLLGNAFDGNDQNGISLVNFDVASLPQPDALATFEVGGATYFVTANEGDARVGLIDEARLSTMTLDPTAYPDAAAIKAAIGRLNVITTAGDTDGDGDIDQITTYGGRGISIFKQNADGTIEKVRETGGEFEAIIARDFASLHNSENLAGVDSRSDNKGPEPEGVSIGVVGDRTYAFVNLERVGGVMVYDITDPANAQYVTYKPATSQDFAPEVNKFIGADDSPTHAPMLLTANEVSNTVTLYSVVSQTEGADKILGGASNDVFTGKGGNDAIDGNGGTDTAVYAGSWTGFSVTNAGATVTDLNIGNGDEGADTLAHVETLRFAGVDVAAASAVNDAPIGVNDNNSGDAVVEDIDAIAVGNVLTNDTDADLALGLGETLAVIGAHVAGETSGAPYAAVTGATVLVGTYGDLTINTDGSYSYALDNARSATNALAEGATANDIFAYQVADAHGLVDTANLVIGVTGSEDAILGTAANNTLNGTAGDDIIRGLAGNDKLNGAGGNDLLYGGLGADTINGGAGVDTASYANAASGVAASLLTNRGSYGEAVGDKFVQVENLTGSAFDDVLSGNGTVNTIHGGDGNDIIEGNGGLDKLFGDGGDDIFVIEATPQLSSLDGGAGFDTILAGADNSVIKWAAFTGIEAISADGYDNVVIAGATTAAGDTINLSGVTLTGIVAINANAGNDTITGSSSADRINGQAGNDTLNGGGGDDFISGGLGVDQLTGGTGADSFLFLKKETGGTIASADTIADFLSSDGDRIDLSGIDANSVNGAGDDAFSFIGTSAFGKVAGQLRYATQGADAYVSGDLNGDGVADLVIHLKNVSTLSSGDFIF
jgi:VCBS repeat-containing protein